MSMISADVVAAPERVPGRARGDSPWTDERIERLKQLLNDGLSCSQIAAELGEGLTRNSIIGKIHRLRLNGPQRKPGRILGARIAGSRRDRADKRRRIKVWRRDGNGLKIYETVTGTEPELPADHCPKPLSILQLTEGVCHWPARGEGISTVFCGDQAVTGHSYCAHHCRIAYRPPEQRTANSQSLNAKIAQAEKDAA